MTFTKIQVIKILRDQIPGMGLREAKGVVDSYELKMFEDRLARAMGEEIRQELRSWAVTFVASRNSDTFNNVAVSRDDTFKVISETLDYKDPEVNTYKYETPFDDDGYCSCYDCVSDRSTRGYDSDDDYGVTDYGATYALEPVKKSSEIWCFDTGIQVLDPDGWNRMDYENSWYEEITRDEFIRRATMSTCRRWPNPLWDEEEETTDIDRKNP